MLILDLGDDSILSHDVLQVIVRTGDSVTVAVVAGDTINFAGSLDAATIDGADGTIANGANQVFTVPPEEWLTSNSRSSLQISGGIYGP